MVLVKKNTIDRVAFEKQMDELKAYIRTSPLDADTLVKKINNATYALTEWVDEREAEPFRIDDWLKNGQSVTVTLGKEDIGDYYGL